MIGPSAGLTAPWADDSGQIGQKPERQKEPGREERAQTPQGRAKGLLLVERQSAARAATLLRLADRHGLSPLPCAFIIYPGFPRTYGSPHTLLVVSTSGCQRYLPPTCTWSRRKGISESPNQQVRRSPFSRSSGGFSPHRMFLDTGRTKACQQKTHPPQTGADWVGSRESSRRRTGQHERHAERPFIRLR